MESSFFFFPFFFFFFFIAKRLYFIFLVGQMQLNGGLHNFGEEVRKPLEFPKRNKEKKNGESLRKVKVVPLVCYVTKNRKNIASC